MVARGVKGHYPLPSWIKGARTRPAKKMGADMTAFLAPRDVK